MSTKDVKFAVGFLVLFVVMMMTAFVIGRCLGRADAENEVIDQRDTLIVKDTVRVPYDVLQTQIVTQDVVRYKYVPITIGEPAQGAGIEKPDTVVKRDTIIQVEDGVAVIPITMKTYTDSLTYKAVVSGYDPKLEEIEVYRENMVIKERLAAPKISLGVQAGMYVTPKGVMPGVGVGVSYRIGR